MKARLLAAVLCLLALRGAFAHEKLTAILNRVSPPEGERGWMQIPWRLTMREGAADANAHDKPLLVWHMRGHPLGATTLPAIVDRRWLWSDGRLRALLAAQLIPVAEDCTAWQRAMHDSALRPFVIESCLADDPAVRRGWGGAAHNRLGLFCLAPSGKPLAAMNDPTRPEDVLHLVETALERYGKLRSEERLLPRKPSGDRPWRWEHVVPGSAMPEKPIVLREYVKDLGSPVPGKPRGFYTRRSFRTSWNMDHVWLPSPEAFLPKEPAVGKTYALPAWIPRHLARLHLLDFVLGRGEPFEETEVKRARLTARVTAVTTGTLELLLEGETRCEAGGVWQPCELLPPSYQTRGMELTLVGRIRFNRAAGSFELFDLAAIGSRWGATALNRRVDVEHDPPTGNRGPAPIGFVFRLFEGEANDAPPPAMAWRMGAKYFEGTR